jgi:hypothetical protein
MHSMAEVTALLAGEKNPLTPWERWSRFLEAGGRFVVEISAALIAVTMARIAVPDRGVNDRAGAESSVKPRRRSPSSDVEAVNPQP